MKKTIILTVTSFLLSSTCLLAQKDASKTPPTKINHVFDLSIGSDGKDNIGSLSYGHIWDLGKKRKWRVGYGLRYSGFVGSEKNFLSAPPAFYGNKEKTDTVAISKPQQNNIALFLTATYRIKRKFEIGFNVDLVGYSFGATQNANFIGNNSVIPTRASANSLTALLVGANDIGMVKSENFIGYWVSENWMARVGVSSLFTEYKTSTRLQQDNDRFRGTSIIPFIAIRYCPNNQY
jgi:hypothetical protein